MISATGFPKISMHKLGGGVKLTGFTMDLKWSEIGSLHMTLIKVCEFIIELFNLINMLKYTISVCCVASNWILYWNCTRCILSPTSVT